MKSQQQIKEEAIRAGYEVVEVSMVKWRTANFYGTNDFYENCELITLNEFEQRIKSRNIVSNILLKRDGFID